MLYDPHYWDDFERAEPPTPRRRAEIGDRRPLPPLRPKHRQGGPVVSLEQARLERLGVWVQTALGPEKLASGTRLSRGFFDAPDDFVRIMELSKAGLLGEGRRLRRVGYGLTPVPDQTGNVGIDDQSLTFDEMTVQRLPDAASRPPEAP
jgi:hypothetical protein